MNTLVKTLQASVSADLEKLGVLSISISSSYKRNLQLIFPTGNSEYTVKCVSGTIYKSDDTVEIAAGNTKSYNLVSNYLYVNGAVTIEISNMYKINGFKCQSGLNPANFTQVSKFAKYTGLAEISISSTNFIGNLEDYVKDAAALGKNTNITITNTWVYFKNETIHGTTYYCDFSTDSSVVTVKDTNSSGSVLGTYNKSTGVWTYA